MNIKEAFHFVRLLVKPIDIVVATSRQNRIIREFILSSERWGEHWNEGQVYVLRDRRYRNVIAFARTWRSPEAPDSCVILNGTVFPAFRGTNIWRMGMSALMERTAKEGVRKWFVDIEEVRDPQNPDRDGRVRLCQKLGFRVLNEEFERVAPAALHDLKAPSGHKLQQTFMLCTRESLCRYRPTFVEKYKVSSSIVFANEM